MASRFGYKCPKTRQEMAEALDPDLPVPVRAKRVKLPTLYDDRHRADHGHRTWKRHREAQYKAA